MKLLYRIAILITWLLLPHLALATAQFPDNILYKGQEYSLHINPLEQYFAQSHSKPEIFNEGIISSACWRGYVATWEIRDQKLYLKKIEKEYEKEPKNDKLETEWREIPLSVIFPNAQEMVHAQWYSGTLRIPQGELLRYVHMGYASIYEEELHIKISQGMVREIYRIDNTNSPDLDAPNRSWREINNMTKTGGIDPDLADGKNSGIAEMERKAVKIEEAITEEAESVIGDE